MGYVLKYAMKYRKRYLLVLVCVLLGIACDVAGPRLVQLLIDRVIIPQNLQIAFPMLVLMVLSILGVAVFKYIQEYLSDTLTMKVCSGLRDDLFDHIQKQNGEFFRRNSSAELMSRLVNDCMDVGQAFGFTCFFSIEIVIHVAVVLVCLFSISPVLSIIPVVFMVIEMSLSIIEERKGSDRYEKITDETALMNKTAGESITGIRTVRAFCREDYEKKKFSRRNRHYYSLSLSLQHLYAGMDSTIESLARILLAVVILFGTILVMHGRMTLGELAGYIGYVNMLIWPMFEVGWLVSQIAASHAAAIKIRKLLDSHYEVKDEGRDNGAVSAESLEFRHVSFSAGKTDILDDISFTLSKGHSIGIMGETGSGKSTIVNLISRFIDPTSGEILVNGRDYESIPLSSLRDNVATVFQHPFLFSETIMENITKGRSGSIGTDRIDSYCELAQAKEFIDRLDDGYDTVIGELGVGLSGGQKQRLCIARAIIKDSPILIFDDSTSSLDMETEKKIQRDLMEYGNDRMKMIIAHRISSVRDCDEIIYLDNGRIAERGTHKELLERKGLYWKTYNVQYPEEDMIWQ